ncbi:MAG: antitoxin Xre/MbcA/ParS toxin-binding domain-containing protein [Opitutales bacterium]|jgi:DNA-binding transcriptional regulator YiaG
METMIKHAAETVPVPARKRPSVTLRSVNSETSEVSAIDQMSKEFSLTRDELSRMTGFSISSLAKWCSGKPPTGVAVKNMHETLRLLEELASVMDRKSVRVWLKKPNPAFGRSTPMQVIERGESNRIYRMIYEIQTGQPY